MCSGRSVDGELPFDETLAMINLDKPNEDQLKLMTDGHGNIRWDARQCYSGDRTGEALRYFAQRLSLIFTLIQSSHS